MAKKKKKSKIHKKKLQGTCTAFVDTPWGRRKCEFDFAGTARIKGTKIEYYAWSCDVDMRGYRQYFSKTALEGEILYEDVDEDGFSGELTVIESVDLQKIIL